MTRSSPPRTLVLAPQVPYPPHQGTTIRNYNILLRLARHTRADLLTFIEQGQPYPHETPLAACCHQIWSHPVPHRGARQRLWQMFSTWHPDMALRLYTPAMAQTVTEIARREHYDLLLVEGIEMAPYMFHFLACVPTQARPRVVFDDHNAEYLLQKRAFLVDIRMPRRWHAALYSLVQWQKLARYETRVCRLADHVVAVSEADREALRNLPVSTPVTVIPNGVDLAYYQDFHQNGDAQAGPMSPLSVVFTGKMDFRPNVDAVIWFLEHVWPRVRDAEPDAHFYIVGRSPHPRIIARSTIPGVFVTGEVPDVRPYIGQARVYVAPLRVGGGTRLKLLEAMAMRRAVVSTSLGAEGYSVQDGEHLLIANTPQDFAGAVINLLRDEVLCQRLGQAAYKFVATRYDWDVIFPQLAHALGLSTRTG